MFSQLKRTLIVTLFSMGLAFFVVSTAAAHDLTLGWNKNPDTENITHYTIYWATHPFDTLLVGSENGPDSLEKVAVSELKDPINYGEPAFVAIHTLTGLDAGIPYYLRITAVNEFHEGPLSDIIETTIPPNGDSEAPSQPVITGRADSSQSVVLQIEASDNVGISRYMLRRNDQPAIELISPTHRDTGLTPESSYTYSVTAIDSAGNESIPSEPVTFTTPSESEPDQESPTMPSRITAQNITDTTVRLSWGASTDNIGVVRYEIHCDKQNTVTRLPELTTVHYSNLQPETTYAFQVIAFDAQNNASQAASLSVTTESGSDGDASLYGILCFIETLIP